MHVGTVGKPENRLKIKEWLKKSNFRGEVSAEENTGFEQVTLNAMFEHSMKNDGYYLYAHTKGAKRGCGSPLMQTTRDPAAKALCGPR
jgi:hypothetical protein